MSEQKPKDALGRADARFVAAATEMRAAFDDYYRQLMTSQNVASAMMLATMMRAYWALLSHAQEAMSEAIFDDDDEATEQAVISPFAKGNA